MGILAGWARHRARVRRLAGTLVVLSLFGIAAGTLTTIAVVEHTAQPEFCLTCHNMEPYYESWVNSSHKDVGCIECHYEPGSLETLEGKFKALSQLSKYVTRTQGTKPWAEVSDQSCMRTGCHSLRLLEGPIEFGRVAFDHRNHLLESRRGRSLRCVTCHSMIMEGDHMSVTESVCFACHFMPGPDGEISPKTGDCLMCHGPPEDIVTVAGRPFDHREYVERGVSCEECHSPVIAGDGMVRKERCHSCHSEIGHIQRFGEVAFMHETHVTDHKVECFECHDEIRHGLLDHTPIQPAKEEGCGTCHGGTHGAVSELYAGTGAIGVPDRPSRMFSTRVMCEACHTGRSGGRTNEVVAGPHGPMDDAPGHSIKAAGNVDCIHCHGTGFNGMLGRWQGEVGAQVERLEPLLGALEAELLADPVASDEAGLELAREARHNLNLVTADGSLGAHNVDYALDTLRAAAQRIDEARAITRPGTASLATEGFPHVSEHGCTACHLGIERAEPVTPMTVGGLAFSHERHVARAGLDCSACHSVEQHGETTVLAADCATCHHAESEDRDVFDCAACHSLQAEMLGGRVAGLEMPAIMEDTECTECHGDPPAFRPFSPAMCVLCHEDGYDDMMVQWQETVGESLERLRLTHGELSEQLSDASDEAVRRLAADAARELDLVEEDGSLGAHHVHLSLQLLRGAGDKLDRAWQAVDPGRSASGEYPFQSEHGCTTCHVTAGLDESSLEARFPHRIHLATTGYDCNACHSVEEHGQTTVQAEGCSSCHHGEGAGRDVGDCTSCHGSQVGFLDGVLEGFEVLAGDKADVGCDQCHGEPEAIGPANESLCRVCHGSDHPELRAAWLSEVAELRGRLQAALEAGERQGAEAGAMASARSALDAIRRDRSDGIHNSAFARHLLTEALRRLESK